MINSWIIEADGRESKLSMLDYAAEIIKNEWLAYSRARILHESEVSSLGDFIPRTYYDESGKETQTVSSTVEIDFTAVRVAVSPWDTKRFCRAISDVREHGFVFSAHNHHIDYIPEINIAVATNGLHHIAAAAHLMTGKAAANVISFEKLYSHLITDGYAWYNAHTLRMICEVKDWRFAALYSVKKMEYDIRNGFADENAIMAYSRQLAVRYDYMTDRTLTLEQLADCVKNHRQIHKLTVGAFAKKAGITYREAFLFEHNSCKRTVVDKIMKALSIDDYFTVVL
jgi:hypothetical protein